MAYAKKTTTKKTTTKKTASPKAKPVEAEEILEEEDIVEEKEEKVEKPVAKKTFHSDDMILCRSTKVGKVVMEGDISKNVYRWMNYGDVAEVEYRDLVSAVRRHSSYIYAPCFVVDDEDFVDGFLELKKFYTEKFTVSELTDILNMNEGEMEDAIAVLPQSAKEEFINLVYTSISDGTLDSVRKIKTLERLLDADFSLAAEIK